MTRSCPNVQRADTVLTLRSRDVIGAFVMKDGAIDEYVDGAANPSVHGL